MIEYLEKLVEEKTYREALKEAERILPLLEDPKQILATHVSVVISHCRLSQEHAAISSGELATNLAKEIGSWDAFGTVCLFVSNAYSRLGQYDDAIDKIYDYLAHLHQYEKTAKYEVIARFNLGTWLITSHRTEEAVKCLWEALAVAERTQNLRHAHGVRQALVDAHLKAGTLTEVPRLLAKCGHFLRTHLVAPIRPDSRIFHIKLRAQHALVTGRLRRAEVLAIRGLQIAVGTEHEFWFHMVLSKVEQEWQSTERAFGHALAARSCAIRENRPDMEAEVNELIHQLSNDHPGVEVRADHYYMSL